jgi:hypothetical protein
MGESIGFAQSAPPSGIATFSANTRFSGYRVQLRTVSCAQLFIGNLRLEAHRNQSAIIPPSTGMEAPVMYDAFAEATKAIT